MVALLLGIFLSGSVNAQENSKLAQTGMKFLNAPSDARLASMGEATTSINMGSAAMFGNPAVLAIDKKMVSLSVGVNKWIADINYNYATASYRPSEGIFGTFAASFVSVDYGELIGTAVSTTDPKGYVKTQNFSPTAFSVGLGYGVALSEKFSVGAAFRYSNQNMDQGAYKRDSLGNFVYNDYKLDQVSYDLGIHYFTGYKSLAFGMSLRNFSGEKAYIENTFQLPLTFKIGVSMDLMDLYDEANTDHSFLLSVDASHPRDNEENIGVGVEYSFMQLLYIRGGYISGQSERDFSAGVGFKPSVMGISLGVDYAYMPFGIFSDVHNISVKFDL